MAGLVEVAARCRIEQTTLERWVALSWIRPVRAEGEWAFSETDIARVDLICDLHRTFEIDEDTIEIILPLLDQIYTLRRQMRLLSEALAELPEDTQRELTERLSRPAPRWPE